MNALTRAHIRAEHRLRALATRGVTTAWTRLRAYDEADVPLFLDTALPVVRAAQRQSAMVTNAYLARFLRVAPVGLDMRRLMGAGVRAGVLPEEVYRRPFVTVWSDLKAGRRFEEAVAAGLARAQATAAMDVQLTMRATLAATQSRYEIASFRRVANPGACAFCAMVDGAHVYADAMALHNNCGCSVEPSTETETSPIPEGVAVHEHGELGAMLGDPSHDFTVL